MIIIKYSWYNPNIYKCKILEKDENGKYNNQSVYIILKTTLINAIESWQI